MSIIRRTYLFNCDPGVEYRGRPDLFACIDVEFSFIRHGKEVGMTRPIGDILDEKTPGNENYYYLENMVKVSFSKIAAGPVLQTDPVISGILAKRLGVDKIVAKFPDPDASAEDGLYTIDVDMSPDRNGIMGEPINVSASEWRDFVQKHVGHFYTLDNTHAQCVAQTEIL